MRCVFTIIILILVVSCSTKYTGVHSDYDKFALDIEQCLKKSCNKQDEFISLNLSLISTLLAYGGGGGGGGSSLKDKFSYKTFNLCLKEKGYVKDETGIFELPYLTCK